LPWQPPTKARDVPDPPSSVRAAQSRAASPNRSRPSVPEHFSRPGCCQNAGLKRPGRDGIPLPQGLHKGLHLIDRHSSIVPTGRLLPFGQEVIKVPSQRADFSPEGRPLALAASRTSSIRPRTREVVSGIVLQRGSGVSQVEVNVNQSEVGHSCTDASGTDNAVVIFSDGANAFDFGASGDSPNAMRIQCSNHKAQPDTRTTRL
jgi:hypothetical protein